MQTKSTWVAALLLVMLCAARTPCMAATPLDTATAASRLALTPANAATYFAEAARNCKADDGKLWGMSTCGPMLFVDPATRHIIASQADADGLLKPTGHGSFSGTLPTDQTIANTSVTWSGTRWIEMLWPLPTDRAKRDTLMAHESYHLIQDQIVPIRRHGDNAQLDSLYGRYTIQLEWRALATALRAADDAARRQAATDALLFRAARYHKFSEAQAAEVALERNEGLAEYTGVMLGNATAEGRKAMALTDLDGQAKNPSFVRSFAYATGPAYGLLLDRYRPQWRKQITHNDQGMAALLATALRIDLAHLPIDRVGTRAATYNGPALLATETARKAKHDREIAHYRAMLVDGPVLALPLNHMKVQFDPRNVLALGKLGAIYPVIRVVDDWGSIDIKQGALMAPDWHRLTVGAPNGNASTGTLHGDGWTLQLAPGWHLAPTSHPGDFTLEPTTATPSAAH